MNDIEKKSKAFDYIMNMNNAEKDLKEFSDVIKQITNLFTPQKINKMNPIDILDFVIYTKEYSENIKPLIIKYGIIGEIQNATKEKHPYVICETNDNCPYKYNCNVCIDVTTSEDHSKGVARITAPRDGCYYIEKKEGDDDG